MPWIKLCISVFCLFLPTIPNDTLGTIEETTCLQLSAPNRHILFPFQSHPSKCPLFSNFPFPTKNSAQQSYALQRSLILTLLDPLHTPNPSSFTLTPNLHSGFELCIVQTHIIHNAHSRNTQSRESRTPSVHQCSTVFAKVVCHCVAAGDGVAAGISAQRGFSA